MLNPVHHANASASGNQSDSGITSTGSSAPIQRYTITSLYYSNGALVPLTSRVIELQAYPDPDWRLAQAAGSLTFKNFDANANDVPRKLTYHRADDKLLEDPNHQHQPLFANFPLNDHAFKLYLTKQDAERKSLFFSSEGYAGYGLEIKHQVV